LELHAVDAKLAFDHWLFIVMPDSVILIDIEHLTPVDGRTSTSAPVTQLESPWETHSGYELSLSV
jgi:hypothetical protein